MYVCSNQAILGGTVVNLCNGFFYKHTCDPGLAIHYGITLGKSPMWALEPSPLNHNKH